MPLKAVVLDTNSLISGLLWDGNEARIVEKTEKKEFRLFI
jgi:predicted nucleic acid-binding protein